MSILSNRPCPVFSIKNTYREGIQFIYPDCIHEWSATASNEEVKAASVKKDVYGNVLNDGNTVSFIKDLKVKGLLSD